MVGKNAVSAKNCEIIISEIKKTKVFDDLIQGGRNRINKGSKNFKKYIRNSKFSRQLYNKFNRPFFYKKVEKKFKKIFKDYDWSNFYDPKSFLKDRYTNKKLMNSKEYLRVLGKNFNEPKVNLDIDFSVSQGGYKLKPHRDDITRLYNFLIYLNDIPKENGGSLTIFKNKYTKKTKRVFKRFPKINTLKIVKEFTPKKGTIIFFQSTPNSYHGVKLFREINDVKRFFIYGSYALNKPVIWKFENVRYLPVIKETNKKKLTSSHNSDYLIHKTA